MAARSSSPTVRRLELGRRLRELRESGGYTPEQIARELECSTTKISRIESGQRVATALDLKVLARFYDLSKSDYASLTSLAQAARQRGWWYDFKTLEEQIQTYVGLESAASSIRQVEATRIPGLLQTNAYMEALIPRLRPPDFWGPDRLVEDIIAIRLKRQERVASGDLEFEVIVDEAALHRRLGDPPVMIEQLQHLIAMSERPNITLQVITFDVGSHVGLDEQFTLLRFSEDALSDMVFSEGLSGYYVHKADENSGLVDEFQGAWTNLSGAVALPPEDSQAWLRRFLAERTHSHQPD